MTAASTTRLTNNNGLSDKILISDYHLSEPITVDTQSSMDVDSCVIKYNICYRYNYGQLCGAFISSRIIDRRSLTAD
ncbi:unnamed protein product [Trichobilharzia regenti]|nr:unnamed protein product [Trichobilharzia regenti]